MTTISNIIRIGNSNGIIIPARMLKALALSGTDTMSITEYRGGLFLKKCTPGVDETPFSVLDRWNEEHGYFSNDVVEDVEEYISAIRGQRHNKEIPQW